MWSYHFLSIDKIINSFNIYNLTQTLGRNMTDRHNLDAARAPDVNDPANGAEEASVDLPSENVRLIRPDIDNDPDDQHLSTGNALLGAYMAHARAKQKAENMTSERQRAANRANARHSTGPTTPEGKAAVRLNACRHGLLARDAVLPGEDVDAFEDLFNQLRAHFLPVGPIEEFLVDRLTNTIWRLQRVPRAETGLFHSRMHGVKVDRLAKLVSSYERTYPELPPMYRITDKTAHTEASEALERAKYERDRDEVLLGRAIDADAKEGDAFAKLARYERSLERSLHRDLDKLYQMQEKRRNRTSSAISDAITVDPEGTE